MDAIADRLLADLAPPRRRRRNVGGVRRPVGPGDLRGRLRRARDSRLILSPGVTPTSRRPARWSTAMRHAGFAPDAAVQACRLLMWATVGFGAVESGAEPRPDAGGRGRPGGDPAGVDTAEVDTLFDLHIRYLIEGIACDLAAERSGSPGRTGPEEAHAGDHPQPERRREGRRRHRCQQGPGPGHGPGFRRGRRQTSSSPAASWSSARQVAGEIRARAGRPWPCAATSATGTNARHWWTPLSPSSGGSTCSVNNAGIAPVPPSLLGVTADLFDKTIAVNLKGPLRLTALAAEHMPSGGSVINISSKAALHPSRSPSSTPRPRRA